jgi:cell division septation protein DedD
MLRSSESETEILLGNKQLLGIFFLVAALIGVAFGGGFMLGRGALDKKVASPSPAAKETTPSNPANPAGGETRTVSPPETLAPDASAPGDQQADQPALGASKHKAEAKAESPLTDAGTVPGAAPNFLPQSGQEFLQVAAVPRNEAVNVADVLRKKGFSAHAVPVPGNAKLYRVIVGPVRDVADLSSTREELRKTGFGKVIVQKY